MTGWILAGPTGANPGIPQAEIERAWSQHILASMVRLGASTAELAYETIELLLGYPNATMGLEPWTRDRGHKPARQDIQKIKDVHDLWKSTTEALYGPRGQGGPADRPTEFTQKHDHEWDELVTRTPEEQEILSNYHWLIRNKGMTPEQAFTQTTYAFAVRRLGEYQPSSESIDDTQEKKLLGGAVKKEEQQEYPIFYRNLEGYLTALYRENPESYKMWPWMVKQLKERFQQNIANGYSSATHGMQHITDITREGGELLSRLKAENKTPQNMDFNQMDFKEFEDWLMQWKKDNREDEAAGEVVYQFHDGWTIQRLTTPEQLQFEGDEMGHCVGGYASQVESGESIIYSLRDDKGMPHTTFEVEGVEGNPHPHPEQSSDIQPIMDANWYHNREMFAPHNMPDESYIAPGKPFDKTFQVTQVQGKSDNTPKPEYQRKIREFLDTLRAKGVKFERSENWYGNNDDEGTEDWDWEGHGYGGRSRGFGSYGEGQELTRGMHDWYDNYYQADHEAWQKGGEDPYGMNAEARTIDVSDFGELLDQTANSLIDEYDQSKFMIHDWKGAAQATYHLYWMQAASLTRGGSEERLKRNNEGFLKEIDLCREHVDRWAQDAVDNEWSYNAAEIQERVAEAYNKLGGKFQEEEEPRLVEAPEDPPSWEYAPWKKTPLNEDLWQDALDEIHSEIEESYAGNAYKYINYLYALVAGGDGHRPEELPDPNQTNGGLLGPDEARDAMNHKWTTEGYKGLPDPKPGEWGGPEQIPGTFSAWVPSS